MKYAFLFIFMLPHLVFATEYCPIQNKGDAIAKLAKELEAACDWSIQKLAEEKIISDCNKAKKKDSSIRFKNEYGQTSLHFTKYGDTYNHAEPYIECKHNKAYKVRLNQLIRQYNEQAYTAQRSQTPRRTSSGSSSSQTRSSGSSSPAPREQEKEKLWSCRVPNYIKTYKIVNEADKFAIENAHGNVCVEYRR